MKDINDEEYLGSLGALAKEIKILELRQRKYKRHLIFASIIFICFCITASIFDFKNGSKWQSGYLIGLAWMIFSYLICMLFEKT